jgi:hypothetical protein
MYNRLPSLTTEQKLMDRLMVNGWEVIQELDEKDHLTNRYFLIHFEMEIEVHVEAESLLQAMQEFTNYTDKYRWN